MTNPYFNNYYFEPEQRLLEDLTEEAIESHGMDVYYVPRNVTQFDKLFGTDDQSTYTNAIQMSAYLENFVGFEGQRDIFTKFGLEIRDQISVVIARRTFHRQIADQETRPNEGDLIYFPLNKKCFMIKYTDNKNIFYALGTLPSYRLTCELFEYSGETFNTGIPEIDIIQSKFSLDVLDNVMTSENNNILTTETGDRITIENYDMQNIDINSDNDDLAITANNIIDYSKTNLFGTLANTSNR